MVNNLNRKVGKMVKEVKKEDKIYDERGVMNGRQRFIPLISLLPTLFRGQIGRGE